MDMTRKCGAWTLGREIGRGAYGVVYFATNGRGETAAVKVCLRSAPDDERYERELRGAKLYRRIPAGEGLVRMLEIGACEGGFYAAMELADDEFGNRPGVAAEYSPKTLSRVIAGERALSVEDALRLGLALAKGLETLQRHHLLHRDIKPGNVIYVCGRPVLSDPGLVVAAAEAASLVGTPGYVPPERFIGAGGDVYSLGLTLKAASFGRPVEELAMGPTLEADTGSPFFPAWWRILNRATHPDASRRHQSAKALLKDLRSLRLKMCFATRTLGLPRLAWLMILVTAFAVAVGVLRVKRSADRSEARWREQDAFIAQETEKANKRVKELKAHIEEMVQSARRLKGAESEAKGKEKE